MMSTLRSLALLLLLPCACDRSVELSLPVDDGEPGEPGRRRGVPSVAELAWSATDFGEATYVNVAALTWAPDGSLVVASTVDDLRELDQDTVSRIDLFSRRRTDRGREEHHARLRRRLLPRPAGRPGRLTAARRVTPGPRRSLSGRRQPGADAMMPVSPPPRTRISRYRSTTGGQLPVFPWKRGGDFAVRCHSVRKVYRSPWCRRGDPVVALDRVDLEIRRGECFGVIGPSGAGKTTLVEILEGLVAPSSGEVQVLGRSWSRDARDLRQRIGVCLPETRLPERSVGECLALFASLHTSPRPVGELLAGVALSDWQDALVSKLSGGQRQRLAIACAMVGAPELLFLDEPTTGLDRQSRRQVWDLLRSFTTGGGTLVLTTSSMAEAERLCDRVAVMDRGRIARIGRPAELIAALGESHIAELD